MLAVVLTACNKTEFQNMNAPAVSGVPIEFSIDDATKALLDLGDGKTVTWEDGDVVGLFQAYGDDYGTWAETALNVPYRYDAKTCKFHPVNGPALWAGSPEDKNKVCVYYPYVEDCTNPKNVKCNITKDQTYDATASSWTMGEGYGFASVMVKDVTWGEPVNLPALNQANAILRLNITNNSDETITLNTVETEVTGSKWLTASWFGYNITNSPVTGGSNGTIYKSIVTTVENGQVAPGDEIDVRVVFRATDLSSTDIKVKVTSDKGEHPSIEFTGGNIGKGATAVKKVVLEPVQEVTTAYSIGDMVEGGVLFWISNDASEGKVLHLEPERIQMKWASEDNVNIKLADSDGSVNVSEIKKQNQTLDSFPAVKYCDDLEGDWYLPARAEFVDMFAGLGNALRDNYGFTFSGVGADKVSSAGNTAKLWTSETSTGGDYIRYCVISTTTGSVLNGAANETNEYIVRCIKKVDLASSAPAQENLY